MTFNGLRKKSGLTTLSLIIFVFFIAAFSMVAEAQEIIMFQQFDIDNNYEGNYATFFPTSDPNAVNGWEETLEWDGSDGGGVNYTLIRFDDIVGTEAWQIPPNSVVISAFLTLYITDPGDAADVHELLVPFDDLGSLNDFNGGVDPREGTDYSADVVSTTPDPSVDNSPIDIDLTTSVQKIVDGEEFFGWVFIPTGGGGVEYSAPWNSVPENRPKLVVMIEGDEKTKGARTVSKSAVNIGDTIDVMIDLTLNTGSEDVTVLETPPFGWDISDISDGGSIDSGVITWNISNFSGTKTISYKATASGGMSSTSEFEGNVNEFFDTSGVTSVQVYVPLYATGNVLAVGVWNDSSSSSDIVATAELIDNDGTVYVRDSADGWPEGTIFRWQPVWDGMAGAEEPGWQQREFDDSAWFEQTDVGFTIGMGSGDYENGETPLADTDEVVYTRSVFDLPNVDTIYQMTLRLEGDDSAVAWLNGVYIGVAGAHAGDNGENPWEYAYNTTTGGGSDVSGEESTDFNPGETFVIMIKPQPTTLTRVIPVPAYIPGEVVSGIQVTANVPAGQTPDLTITETPPAGWAISNIQVSAGETQEDNGTITWTITKASGSPTLTYDVTPVDVASADWASSGTDGTFTILLDGDSTMAPHLGPVKLYKEGNVLAVGVWNSDNGSSDLVLTAELSDNNGNVYVRDSGAPEGWPEGTIFRWKTVLFEDGTGAEEPGWQEMGFDDSQWTEQTDTGFTIGQGGGSENGETAIDGTHETVYTRSIFDIADYDSIKTLTLKIEADDTGIAWINGEYVAFDGGGEGDNGEVVPDFTYVTTTNGRSGDVSGEANTDYVPGTTVYLLVDLVDATAVFDWALF